MHAVGCGKEPAQSREKLLINVFLTLSVYVSNSPNCQQRIGGPEQRGMNWQGEGACEEEKVKYKDRPSLECYYLPAAGVGEGKLSKGGVNEI